MKTIFKNNKAHFTLLICCLVSRILTTIYYIEDTDSLRFALSINDYDITKLQPHFPGYPIFCFFAKILYFFTNSFAVSFSILGALSIFSITFFMLKIIDVEFQTFKGALLAGLVFLNPLFWLLSNRYMPDLMGLAFTISAFYFLYNENNHGKKFPVGFFLSGILAGVRLSYLPTLLVPFFYKLFISTRKSYLALSFFAGCLVWLIPFIWVTGIENLFNAAMKQTHGHFSDFGGTIITESNLFIRFLMVIKSIWADGLGGYWIGRSWQTSILSFLMLYVFYLGLGDLSKWKNKRYFLLILSFMVSYGLWILFFQNVIYKSRHILPLLIPAIIVLHHGSCLLLDKKSTISKMILCVFFIFFSKITIVLVLQHKSPSAISKVKDHLINQNNNQVIVSAPLINYYLRNNGVLANYVDIETKDDIENVIITEEDSLIMIGNFKNKIPDNFEIINDSTFYHNPYVNQMWSTITLYKLLKKVHGN